MIMDMKQNKHSIDRWLGAHRKRFLAGLFLAMGLVVASLTISASGNGRVGDVRIAVSDNGEEVFNAVDKMPSFPGGDAALMTFIRDNISYPPEAAERNIQGKVVVQFVVDSTGQVGEMRVVRSADPDLDREAVRVIGALPKFVPGTLQGKPVNVWYTLPVTFKLNNDISYLLSFIHDVDSIRIDYCNLELHAPMVITPAIFDAGQFNDSRETVLVKRKWKIKEVINAMGGLAKLSQGQLDTRGKITIYIKEGNKRVAYYDKSALYYRGNYYDISTFTAAGAEFRKILFPLIGQTE